MTDSISLVRRRRRRANRPGAPRRGTASVEAALLLPILVLVTLFSIDLSQYLHLHLVVTNASREVSRVASRASVETVEEVEDAVVEYLAESFPKLSESTIRDALDITIWNGNQEVKTSLASIPTGQKLSAVVAFDFSSVRWMNAMEMLNGSRPGIRTIFRRE